MKKRISYFLKLSLFVFLMANILAACSAKGDQSNKAHASGLSEQARLITNVDGMMGLNLAYTEAGQYSMLRNGDGSHNILYIDYTTQSRVFLCNRPECEHNDASCVSWLSPEDCAGGAGLFTDGKKLYVQRIGTGIDLSNPDAITEASASQIIRMDLNGDNRETIIKMESGASVNGAVAADGSILYFIMGQVQKDADDIAFTQQLVALDSENKSIVSIAPVNENDHLIGVCKAGFLFRRNATQNDSRSYSVYLLRLSTKKEEPIMTWTERNILCRVDHQTVYFLDPNSASFFSVDPDTKEKKIIADHLPFNADDKTECVEIFDQKLRFDVYEHGVKDEAHTHSYALSLADGGITEETLCYTTPDSSVSAVEILAENETQFLVMYDLKLVAVQDTSPDGSPYTFDMAQYCYGLISKEDYWNNRANYIPIQDDADIPVG